MNSLELKSLCTMTIFQYGDSLYSSTQTFIRCECMLTVAAYTIAQIYVTHVQK